MKKDFQHVSWRYSHAGFSHLTAPAIVHYSVFAQHHPNQNELCESLKNDKTARFVHPPLDFEGQERFGYCYTRPDYENTRP